jgi:hypothetical protein
MLKSAMSKSAMLKSAAAPTCCYLFHAASKPLKVYLAASALAAIYISGQRVREKIDSRRPASPRHVIGKISGKSLVILFFLF